jgi:hypothetical protein
MGGQVTAVFYGGPLDREARELGPGPPTYRMQFAQPRPVQNFFWTEPVRYENTFRVYSYQLVSVIRMKNGQITAQYKFLP